MSVRHGLLALLQRGPMYGYQLRVAFEESTGGTWPLNIGQVYTTLSRLERDELVRPLPKSEEGQRPYEITDAGRADLATWFATPVSRTDRPRDELTIKLALALTTPGVDVRAVVQTQRSATMRTLQEYTRLKARADQPADLSWRLVLDAMLFQAEVEGTVLGACSRVALAALRRRRVGYVFQDLNLLASLTAAENVALPLELDGIGVRQAWRQALAALSQVDLAGYGPRFPDELSGGQQQRVAIARALIGERRLVLADEPTGALDSQAGEAVLRLLRAKVDAGAAGVLVTHEARHAAWADRVVFLRDGVIVDTSGPLARPEELLAAPGGLR